MQSSAIVFQHGRGFLLFPFGFQTETDQAFHFGLLGLAFQRGDDVGVGVAIELDAYVLGHLCVVSRLRFVFFLGFYCASPPVLL